MLERITGTDSGISFQFDFLSGPPGQLMPPNSGTSSLAAGLEPDPPVFSGIVHIEEPFARAPSYKTIMSHVR